MAVRVLGGSCRQYSIGERDTGQEHPVQCVLIQMEMDRTKRWADRHDCGDMINFESTAENVLALNDDDLYNLNITGYNCPKNKTAIVQVKIPKHSELAQPVPRPRGLQIPSISLMSSPPGLQNIRGRQATTPCLASSPMINPRPLTRQTSSRHSSRS